MQIYDRRKINDKVNKKWVRVLTVLVYVVSISIVALVLGLYYKFVWSPKYETSDGDHRSHPPKNAGAQSDSDLEVPLGVVNVVNLGTKLESVSKEPGEQTFLVPTPLTKLSERISLTSTNLAAR